MPKSRNRNKKKSAYSAQRPTGRNRGTANWNVFLQEQAALQATTSQQSTASALPESFTTIREEPLIPSQSSSSTSLISLPASLSIPDQESCELDCQISELDPFTGSASSSETTGSVQRNEEDGTSNSQSSTSSTNVASAPAGRQKKINEKKPSNSKKRLEKPIPMVLKKLAGTGFMLAKVHPSPETSPPPSRWFTPLFPMEETVFPIQARLVTHLTLRNSDVYDNPAAIGQTGVRPQFTRDVCIALDCEMVGIMDGRENMLARVSLVDMSGNCIYDTFVRAERPVVDYRTHVSGVRPVDEQNGARFQLVRRVVATIINNRILIGHALKNDLAVLGITVKRRFIRDTAYYRPLREPGWLHVTPSLKRLAQRLLNQTIQEGEHSSITDARVTMQIYLLHRNEWEKFLLRKFYDLL